MREIAASIWNLSIQIVPVALCILLLEAPALIRRHRKLLYMPVYFMVFPLREINVDLARYLAQDHMYGFGERMDEAQLRETRHKVVRTAVISTVIAAVVTPLIVGFLAAFFADSTLLWQVLGIVIVYKGLLLAKSVVDFRNYGVSTKRNRVVLSLVYFLFLGVLVEIMRTAHSWARPYVTASDWTGLASALSGLVFGKVIVGGLFVALLTAVFVNLILDRSVRDRELRSS